MDRRIKVIALCFLLTLCMGCSKQCTAPNLNVSRLLALRSSMLGQGSATGSLITPNPADATGNGTIDPADSTLGNYYRSFNLVGLSDPSRLENDFLHIRIHTIHDDLSILATPNSNGQYAFPLTDPHYSETLAWLAVSTELAYLGALGFPLVKTRPLYVMVRADSPQGNTQTDVNALYDHNYLNPSLPRTIRLFGNTQFAPAEDEDVPLHEFGHYFNESASHEVGIDFAGDNGAFYTEGAALHECLADYLSETIRNRAYIGRWIGRNFPDTTNPGDPLRAAFDLHGKSISFSSVAIADGTGQLPERYHTAEWCERVLWVIRTQFVNDDKTAGAIYSDRLMFSALSYLTKDTSLQQYHDALLQADNDLYCGNHQDVIKNAFNDRGWVDHPDSLDTGMQLQAAAIGIGQDANGNYVATNAAPGGSVAFAVAIRNPSGHTARNVRVRIESRDRRLLPTTYMQGYGDIPPGHGITVSGNGRGLTLDFAVQAELDQSASGTIPYTIRLMSDNGDDVVYNGNLQL